MPKGTAPTPPRPQTGTARRNSKAAHRARQEEAKYPLLSIETAASYLGVSRWTMYRIVANGDIPTVIIGQRQKIRPSDLDAYANRAS